MTRLPPQEACVALPCSLYALWRRELKADAPGRISIFLSYESIAVAKTKNYAGPHRALVYRIVSAAGRGRVARTRRADTGDHCRCVARRRPFGRTVERIPRGP